MSNEDRFTLRSAVYVFFIKDKKLLLLKRKNTGWMDGKYTVPAGHLDDNESILDAAVRETKEEAGVTIKKVDLELVHVMQRKSEYNYIDFFFMVKRWTGKPYLAEEEKSDHIDWFSVDDLPANMVPNQKQGFEMYRNKQMFSLFGLK